MLIGAPFGPLPSTFRLFDLGTAAGSPVDLHRVNEWVNGTGSPKGAAGYLASAANAAAAGRAMLAQGGCTYG